MPELRSFHHVKLPVSDLQASRSWFEQTLGLKVQIEFTEEDELRGLALTDETGTVGLALRLDPERARALAGFDPIALGVPTRDEVRQWANHLDSLGEEYGGVVTGHGGGAVLVGLRDPDGHEIRLYAD